MSSTPANLRDRTVEVYDFGRPTTLAREHARALDLAFETFSRQWGTQLAARMRVASKVRFEQVVIQPCDEYEAALPAVTAASLIEVGGQEQKAVVQFPVSAALSWITSMLGGDGSSAIPERAFTPIEQELMLSLVGDTCGELRFALGALLPFPLSVDSIHHNMELARPAAPTALMVVATFSISVGAVVSPATVAIPAELILRKLRGPDSVVTTRDARSLLEGQILSSTVEIGLRFNSVQVTTNQLVEFRIGDTLTLPHETTKPLKIEIDNQLIAHASPADGRARLACVVTPS